MQTEIAAPFDDPSNFKPYKVLVVSDFTSSHKKNMDAIAIDLSNIKWPGNPDANMFNVTLFCEREPLEHRKLLNDTFHLVEWDYRADSLFGVDGPNHSAIKKHENALIDGLVRG